MSQKSQRRKQVLLTFLVLFEPSFYCLTTFPSSCRERALFARFMLELAL